MKYKNYTLPKGIDEFVNDPEFTQEEICRAIWLEKKCGKWDLITGCICDGCILNFKKTDSKRKWKEFRSLSESHKLAYLEI